MVDDKDAARLDSRQAPPAGQRGQLGHAGQGALRAGAALHQHQHLRRMCAHLRATPIAHAQTAVCTDDGGMLLKTVLLPDVGECHLDTGWRHREALCACAPTEGRSLERARLVPGERHAGRAGLLSAVAAACEVHHLWQPLPTCTHPSL